MEWSPEIMQKLEALRSKIEATGQDFETYVNGWQMQRFQNYWDYIQLDTLLSLQRPVTRVDDEPIFSSEIFSLNLKQKTQKGPRRMSRAF